MIYEQLLCYKWLFTNSFARASLLTVHGQCNRCGAILAGQLARPARQRLVQGTFQIRILPHSVESQSLHCCCFAEGPLIILRAGLCANIAGCLQACSKSMGPRNRGLLQDY